MYLAISWHDWGFLRFSMEELEKMIDNLSPEEPKLKELTKELLDEEKLYLLDAS
ncbi:MAG: hypothetical protein JO297_06400 [Nitrososphaeraceae archaeon]|nr:hypothetical protein [Nitrososphaeraceae archaeon]